MLSNKRKTLNILICNINMNQAYIILINNVNKSTLSYVKITNFAKDKSYLY